MDDPKLIDSLKEGKIAVIPTDTIYGIVGLALNPATVEKIYRLRKRNFDKPFIILISSIHNLEKFGVLLTNNQINFLQTHWPNPLSVILDVTGEKFKYLHRGKKSLAFRMPKDEKLLEILESTGPMAAPSANFEGEKPAENIEEAKKFFGNGVDFYVDGGEIKSNASTLIKFEGDQIKILRQGVYKLSQL